MNHRTPAEDFRATLAALSREQLIVAMHYLRARDRDAMETALEIVTVPIVTAAVHFHAFIAAEDGGTCACGLRLADWGREYDDAELDHMAIEGTRS